MGFSVGDIVQSNNQTGLVVQTKCGYQGWDWITVHWFGNKHQSEHTYVYPVDKTILATFKVIT